MTPRTLRHALVAGAVALALGLPGVAAADDTNSKTQTSGTQQSLTGKEKATVIGAGTGAVAGALVGGPVGAVVGAGVGGYIGNKGTDANGRVDGNAKVASNGSTAPMNDLQVRKAQTALNERGYRLAVDGVFGPRTEHAVRDFQGMNGLAQTGSLDGETLDRLGVTS